MKREFHAQFPLALQDSVTQGFAIAWLVKQSTRLPARWPDIAQIEDDWARLEILSQAIVTSRKEEARMGTRKMSGGLSPTSPASRPAPGLSGSPSPCASPISARTMWTSTSWTTR